MKTAIRLLIISMLLLLAIPAYAGTAVLVFECQQDEEASDEDVVAAAVKWLKVAKTLKGGEGLEVYVSFPVAATMGENDFEYIIIAPSFKEWGEFVDGYKGSKLAEEDESFTDVADCTDSSLWTSVKAE